jgi:hypothetical protein
MSSRERRVDIAALVYTWVLGFDRSAKRTLASFRRAYAIATGTTLARSAFYDRFTPEFRAEVSNVRMPPLGDSSKAERWGLAKPLTQDSALLVTRGHKFAGVTFAAIKSGRPCHFFLQVSNRHSPHLRA